MQPTRRRPPSALLPPRQAAHIQANFAALTAGQTRTPTATATRWPCEECPGGVPLPSRARNARLPRVGDGRRKSLPRRARSAQKLYSVLGVATSTHPE